MKARADRARRMLAAQAAMRRLEEMRLTEIRARCKQLETAQEELIAALNDDAVLHGLFIDAAARRLTDLSKQAVCNAQEEKSQRSVLLVQATRARQAERLSEKADRELQADEERKRLLEIAEQRAAAASPASGKLVER